MAYLFAMLVNGLLVIVSLLGTLIAFRSKRSGAAALAMFGGMRVSATVTCRGRRLRR
jgi:hypothetical protein